MKTLLPLAALLALAAPALAADAVPSPGEIVAAAPKAEWAAIPASDLLVMDLAPDPRGKPRRVVIQLIPPPFSQGWIGNIRKLAAAHWWDGLSVNRVQDNYVVQWGDADGEDKAKAKRLLPDLTSIAESEYVIHAVVDQDRFRAEGMPWKNIAGQIYALQKIQESFASAEHPSVDPYASITKPTLGWPVAGNGGSFWPVHCYGMVGVGRDLSPNTGSGAELYTVIGHAPRHLDRNIALVGRVIEGIGHLSSLPRGTGALGFYETAEERTEIVSIRLGDEVSGLPAYEYLSTEGPTFARYAEARANRRDPFFIRPAGGADICNIPVPVRQSK